jgi:hypothetical protein
MVEWLVDERDVELFSRAVEHRLGRAERAIDPHAGGLSGRISPIAVLISPRGEGSYESLVSRNKQIASVYRCRIDFRAAIYEGWRR